jgi:hypothetical protein
MKLSSTRNATTWVKMWGTASLIRMKTLGFLPNSFVSNSEFWATGIDSEGK